MLLFGWLVMGYVVARDVAAPPSGYGRELSTTFGECQ
jgi:hypothetical protein